MTQAWKRSRKSWNLGFSRQGTIPAWKRNKKKLGKGAEKAGIWDFSSLELTSGVRDFLKVLEPAKRKENPHSERISLRKTPEKQGKPHKIQKFNLSRLPTLFSLGFWLQIPKKTQIKSQKIGIQALNPSREK